jgi:hypothetical protein
VDVTAAMDERPRARVVPLRLVDGADPQAGDGGAMAAGVDPFAGVEV